MKYSKLIEALGEISLDPVSEARAILEYCLGIKPSQIPLIKDKDLDDELLNPILNARRSNTPLQYILGKWEFMGNEFIVNENCLIPRSDTEILCEKALTLIKKDDHVADFCTGSGCIGLSLLLHSPLQHITLVDISKGALDVAEENAKKHSLEKKCTLINDDIRELPRKGQFDLVVSNPPYIPTKDIDTLSKQVQKEPRLALDGGQDGLDIIDFLITDGLDFLAPQGKMLIEFGYDQGEIMDTSLAKIKKEGKIKDYQILYDYGRNPRVAYIEK
ncbi:MAG: peptide chain release factor N(5)-glutamine methyltransferase [Clostridia bacterium]|nr:peptide chain release factor N(5)-glutamine methyltransferase [Clostridia bacterium]